MTKRVFMAFFMLYLALFQTGCIDPDPIIYKIKVRVTDEPGAPLKNVKISITTSGCDQLGQSFTDDEGNGVVQIQCNQKPNSATFLLEKNGQRAEYNENAISIEAVYGYKLQNQPDSESAPTTPGETPFSIPLSPTRLPTQRPASSPSSSQQLAFVREQAGLPQIFLTDISETFFVQVTNNSSGACQPTWSPDGLALIFISPCERRKDKYNDTSLYIIPVQTNPQGMAPRKGELLYSPSGGAYEPSWSTNGIIYTGNDGGGRRQIYYIAYPSTPSGVLLSNPVSEEYSGSFSLDGNTIIFFRALPGYREGLLYWATLDNFRGDLSRNQVVNSNFDDILEPDWQPGGDLIVFVRENQLWTVIWKARKTDQVTKLVKAGSIHDPDWSYDGRFIAFSVDKYTFDLDIWYVPLSGSPPTPIAVTSAPEYHPAWRPMP